MQSHISRVIFRGLTGALIFCTSLVAESQQAGLLYDPEPPVDSAYVRVLLASHNGAIDVTVDGRIRIQKLAAESASDYMVLSAGKHTVAIHPAGNTVASLSTSVDVVRGRAITIAFTSMRTDTVPIIFEDKSNSNKLKALIAVYHLDAKVGILDVLTADGNTKVFSGLAFGTSASILVNPISIELVSSRVGDKASLSRSKLDMAQGAT
jgi:hypothetical protein